MSQVYGEIPSFSIMDVLRGMGRRKVLMLGCLTIGTLIGLGIILVVKPKYQSEARVLIDNFSTPYDIANVALQDRQDKPEVDERTIASQVAVLQSEDLGQRVIGTLKLGEKSEFDPLKNGLGVVKKFLIAAGFVDDPRLMTEQQRAFEQLNSSIVVYPIPESNVIGIKYTSAEGQVAADVANTLAETYVLSTRESRSGDNDRSRKWLSSQIEGLRQKVSQSDAAVEAFRAEAGLFQGQNATLGAQETSELNSQITLAEAARTEAQAKADEIREMLERQGSVEASSEVMASPTIQRLGEQQSAAERRINELSATYLSNHPKMIAARKEIADVDKRMRKEALKIVEGLQGQAKIAAARAASLRNSLEGLKDREGGSLQDNVKLKELEREAKANRDQLETMLARFADSNTRQNLELQPGFARVIQTASVPAAPYFPKTGPIILLAALAGLGLGVGLAFLFEIMAQAARMNELALGNVTKQQRSFHPARVAMDDDFEIPKLDIRTSGATASTVQPSMTPTPSHGANTSVAPMILASIPQARSGLEARALLSALGSEGEMQSTLGQLSLHLQAMRSKGTFKACAIAGVGCGEEVAALALALARNLADNGLKTILVDLEAQRCIIPDLMELPYAPGLTELLSGSSDFSKAIQHDRLSKLKFLRHGNLDVVAEEQLPLRMEAVTKTLAGIYDVVLLHAGDATPALLNLVKGCGTVLLHTTVSRKMDAVAAAGTLKANGFENIYLIEVDAAQRVAA